MLPITIFFGFRSNPIGVFGQITGVGKKPPSVPIWIMSGPIIRGSGTPPNRPSRMSPVWPRVVTVHASGKLAAPFTAGTIPTSVWPVYIEAAARAVVPPGVFGGAIVTIGASVYALPTVTIVILITRPVTGSTVADAVAPIPTVSPGAFVIVTCGEFV
jgi:hypothetical protein